MEQGKPIVILEEVQEKLYGMQDTAYRDFQLKLIPPKTAGEMIGVRTPALRKYAKELGKREDIGAFLSVLPHRYFDEDQLHAFVISGIRDYGTCLREVERFLPYVDNWATCDQLSPGVFKKHKAELMENIRKWIQDGHVYTVRFAIGMLMQHFLDAEFDPAYPEMVCAVRSQEYYINMMIAWYFATALAKQYETVIPYIEEYRLDKWTHQKTIQKAVESNRITPEQKEYLRGFRLSGRQ